MTDELAAAVDSLEEDICIELRRAGVLKPEVYRIYPPEDTGEEATVLLLGHTVPNAPQEPITARMRPGSTPILTPGW